MFFVRLHPSRRCHRSSHDVDVTGVEEASSPQPRGTIASRLSDG
jgi:hypothetical protein